MTFPISQTTWHMNQVAYDIEGNPEEIDVSLREFMQRSLQLRDVEPDAFYAHCAAICNSIQLVLVNSEELDHPPAVNSRAVGRLHRDDIDVRRRALTGVDGSVFTTYKYAILDHGKRKILCAEMTVTLLGADGILYKTTAYASTIPLRTNTRKRNGQRIDVLHPDRLLTLLYRQAGLEAFAPLRVLGLALTDAAAWAMLDQSLSPTPAPILPELY